MSMCVRCFGDGNEQIKGGRGARAHSGVVGEVNQTTEQWRKVGGHRSLGRSTVSRKIPGDSERLLLREEDEEEEEV